MRKVVLDGNVPIIRSALVGPLVRALEKSGLDVDAFLAEFGMSRRLLSNPYQIVPFARYVAAFEKLSKLIDEPELGLHLGSELQLTDLGPAGVVFLSSSTLRAAITHFSRALASWQSGMVCELLSERDWSTWVYRVSNPSIWPRQQDTEYTLSTMCNMIRSVLGATWNPAEVHFEHAEPANTRGYARIFRSTLCFEQPFNGVTLRKKDLDTALRTADVKMAKMMERHAADLIEQSSLSRNLVDQVRELVQRGLAHEELGVDAIASTLGISTRSLQRHLKSEGTSVRQIVREVRIQNIESLERRDGLSVAAIARAVGYADGTVLWRAKRSWERD
jgi:AraC-like DNA-binding protein